MKILQKIAVYTAVYEECARLDLLTKNRILDAVARGMGLEHSMQGGYFCLCRRDRVISLLTLKQQNGVKNEINISSSN